ncbi:MAG: hypothetical protein JWP97_2301 [Labilithrix sp.]|nr:hypothetical protein [Labilithrix sp.]
MQLTRAFLAGVLVIVSAGSARAQGNQEDNGGPAAAPAATEPAPASAPAATEPAAPAGQGRTSNLDVRVVSEVAGYLDSTATSVLTPSIGATVENPTAGWGASGHYLVDVVSAASPDIVSTASPNFKEVRQAGGLGGRYKPGLYGVAANANASYSNDYLSLSAGAQLTQDLDEKNLTLIEGYGFGHDVIGRTGTPFDVFSRKLDYHMLTLGLSRVVNPGLVLGLYGDAILERGDQSKPYRYIPLFAPEVAPTIPVGAGVTQVADARVQWRPLEQLPLERNRFALTGRMGWRRGGTTLRVEERGYVDSWGLVASTTDARYFIDVSERITIWPHGRFNIQNGVDFWQRTYVSTSVHDIPALRTGDRELGPLRTLGGGGGIRVALGKSGALQDLVLTGSLDAYWTHFLDALYVEDRLSALAAVGLEVGF